ncbi:MAG: GTPase HflX [Caulobacteraceae bacterium]
MENTAGIKKSIIKRLEAIEELSVDKDQLVSEFIIEEICDITGELGKEIAVYIDRRGEVIEVEIGDEDTVALKSFDRRRSDEGLSCVRCIHTHPNGSGILSDVDLSALKRIRFDVIAAIGVLDGRMTNASISFLGGDNEKQMQTPVVGPYNRDRLLKLNITDIINDAERSIKETKRTSKDVESEKERAILVGIENENALEELRELLKTAGGEEAGRMVQSREKLDTAYLIGKGKLKELMLLSQVRDANLVVFDEELSGAQTRNLEEALEIKVIDRTQLILDIFAQRAKSREGKLQVELAQLKYMLPRLIGLGAQMSRTGGGIGTRGPGEKKLEIDRRKIRDRVNDLENEIKELKKHRSLQRESRVASKVFQVCLVGYTNAGKSTLLNCLAYSDVYAQDQLFATLDPTTRKVELPNGKEILVTDTVGFIRKLPHDLVEAFKSTLEEVLYADLLIHVVDGSNPEYEMQARVVMEVLRELGAEDKKIIMAINKVDKMDEGVNIYTQNDENGDTIYISAVEKRGIDVLLSRIEHYISELSSIIELMIPYSDGNMASMAHENAIRIIEEEYKETGIYIKAEVDAITSGRLSQYVIK